jgi:hypothetical protein
VEKVGDIGLARLIKIIELKILARTGSRQPELRTRNDSEVVYRSLADFVPQTFALFVFKMLSAVVKCAA